MYTYIHTHTHIYVYGQNHLWLPRQELSDNQKNSSPSADIKLQKLAARNTDQHQRTSDKTIFMSTDATTMVWIQNIDGGGGGGPIMIKYTIWI